MADSFQYPSHAHYYQSEHVQLPTMAHSTSDFHSSPPQQYPQGYSMHQSPYQYSEADLSSLKGQPLDSMVTLSSPQQAVYPTFQKDVTFASDAQSIATSRYPAFNTPQQQEIPQEKLDSFWVKFLPNSMACRLYILAVLVETIVDIAIEVDLLVLLKSAESKDSDASVNRLPVYLVVFGLAHLFQLMLALDAVHAQNTLQFMFLAGFNVALLGYAIVQKQEISEIMIASAHGVAKIPVDAMTSIIIVVIAISEIAYVGLGYKIYQEFGWKVYKLLGADRGIKRMFMHLQIFMCLCKFDVFFFIGFGVQWIVLVIEPRGFEYYVTIAALPFSIVVLAVGHAAAHKENKWLMATFVAGAATACVYFVYKFWKILAFRHTTRMEPVFASLVIFSVLAIVLLVTTFVWSMIVMNNFGNGLKTRVSKHRKGASIAFSSRTGRVGNGMQFEMSAHPHRLSID
ncbi:hypothetical protein BKA62DRAFT_693540 [Auriculariales sp. MPI-PUGE-AT-0066]|nr:hypothetical protein BKA62DRAFT_693540 [Auriculariales sp. MPI-PUGE-AT-0066]